MNSMEKSLENFDPGMSMKATCREPIDTLQEPQDLGILPYCRLLMSGGRTLPLTSAGAAEDTSSKMPQMCDLSLPPR